MNPWRFHGLTAVLLLAWLALSLPSLAQPARSGVAPAPRILSRGPAAGSYQAFPDVCRLANGDLLCVFYAGHGHVSLPRADWPRGGRICCVRSEDDGQTWSEPRVLFDGPDDDRDPHVAQLRDGTVVCSFFPYRQGAGEKAEFETAIVVSRDGGWSWEPRHRVLAPGWAVSAPVRTLSDGTLLLGVYREEGATAYGGVLRSGDGGRTWSGPISIGQDSGVRLDAETDVVELRDGTVLAALRGDKVPLHFARSRDGGRTWGRVVDAGFPGHCPHFTRLRSGAIILSHRLPSTAMHVSRDDGTTWGEAMVIDAVGGAYPATVELNDGTVLVVYYEEGAGSAIRARRFRLGEAGVEWLSLGVDARDVGSRRELFVDRYLVDRMEGCELRLQKPVERGVALVFDKPWEGAFSGYVTVIQDGDAMRMYYRGLPVPGQDGSTNEVTCYAESRDGVTWTKPSLGLFEVMGTRSNNVVLAGQAPFSHNFSPFLDTRAGVAPGERYKALAGTVETGLHGFVSADGLRWRRMEGGPLLKEGAFDSQNVGCWSESEGCYVVYLRSWTGGGFAGFRSISRATSADFRAWSKPEPMTFGDAPPEHLYTSQTQPYPRAPGLMVATPMRFVPGRRVLSGEQEKVLGVSKGYASDAAEAVLMTSRGGTRYQRTFLEGFIRPGMDAGNWASRAGLTALGIIQTGPGEMSVYKQAHYAQASCHLVRHALRLDGLASVHASFRGGEMVTHPLRFRGSRLRLNLSTGAAGSVWVEVQDAGGTPLPGLGLADCREIAGDELAREVKWGDAAALLRQEGQPVRLRFVLRDADVYALQFGD